MTVSKVLLLTAAVFASIAPFDSHGQSRDTASSDDIASIIYSALPEEQMLQALSDYIAIGDELGKFKERTGLDLGLCLVGGPGVISCSHESGLQIIADPDGIVRILRRSEKTIEGKKFNEQSISTNILEWKGYVRGYPD
ncbi:hypothetical protein H0E84_15095 [Luteimonas sp. SJ-92]|uniref:Uncharacterized protein n=1 Tax=Luteimonas salinisoli TaxID=2752307 RepID=A0A853JEF2_9GAMM|nr:hypothetical protein [Luteimonas salinisoli]NZA27706.1 hypothetical protein [Luteimonas salinisoli]